jgi:hypothetical protein
MKYELTPTEENLALNIFDALDNDQDGILTSQDYTPTGHLPVDVERARKVHHLFDLFDTNKDGSVSKTEFLTACEKLITKEASIFEDLHGQHNPAADEEEIHDLEDAKERTARQYLYNTLINIAHALSTNGLAGALPTPPPPNRADSTMTEDDGDGDGNGDGDGDCAFIDIFSKKEFTPEIEINKIEYDDNTGMLSSIELYMLLKKDHERVCEKINYPIDNIIIKKKLVDNGNVFVSQFGGIQNQWDNEINSLLKLYKKKHFPVLLSYDTKKLTFYVNYCGTPLENDNIPFNWKEQLNTIITTLKATQISHNDMHGFGNFLVHDGILNLIDFGWATETNKYPFKNINDGDLLLHTNFIELLDDVCKRSIKERIENNLWIYK